MSEFHSFKQQSPFFKVGDDKFIGVFYEHTGKLAATGIEFTLRVYEFSLRKIVSVAYDMVVFAVYGRDMNDTRLPW